MSSWFRTWWWAAAFSLLVGLVYGHGMQSRNRELEEAMGRLAAVEAKTVAALEEKEHLALRLSSESDPAWIELVLLRQMGVVPEGFLKVHFKR